MNYLSINDCDQANGPGLRVSLFVSGCSLHCKGCFNQESWDCNAGKPFGLDDYQKLFKALDKKYISGLSILGGDPFEESNMPVVHGIVQEFRNRFKDTKTIWIWSGRKYGHLLDHCYLAPYILELCDVLVDGPYIEKQKVQEKGKWFGSNNQRVLLLSKKAKDWWSQEGYKYEYMRSNVFNVYNPS